MASSILSTPTYQALAANIKNADGTTPLYLSGAWTFQNASAQTVANVTSDGVWTFGIGTNEEHKFRGRATALYRNAGRNGSFFTGFSGSGYPFISYALAPTSSTNVVEKTTSDNMSLIELGNSSEFLKFYGFASTETTIGNINYASSGILYGYVTNAGAWLLGPSNSTVNHTLYGYGASYGTPGIRSQGGSGDYIGLGVYSASVRKWDLCSIVSGSPNYFLLREAVSGNIGFRTTTAGECYQGNNSSTWSVSSDIRIKQNIRQVNNCLDKITALNPVHFEYIDKPEKIKTGFIAQEFEQILPGHVSTSSCLPEIAALKPELKDEDIKSIDADLIPYLVGAIKEQQAQIEQLKSEVEFLRDKVSP